MPDLIVSVHLRRFLKRTEGQERYPQTVHSNGQKALYDNLNQDPELTILIDDTVKYTAKDGWRANRIKERQVKQAIKKKLPDDVSIDLVMEVIRNQHEY